MNFFQQAQSCTAWGLNLPWRDDTNKYGPSPYDFGFGITDPPKPWAHHPEEHDPLGGIPDSQRRRVDVDVWYDNGKWHGHPRGIWSQGVFNARARGELLKPWICGVCSIPLEPGLGRRYIIQYKTDGNTPCEALCAARALFKHRVPNPNHWPRRP